ncbi:MAG TPA: ATP-binding protein [Parafilimonas sp.]|nr:ATP-binding protein [Parafilimonas sp.]
MINRTLKAIIENKIDSGKAIIVSGARQTGKTTLVKQFLKEDKYNGIYLNADDPIVAEQLSNANTQSLKRIIGTAKLVIIDEAQRVKNIGIRLKLIVDTMPGTQLLVTGSSALELADEMNEPLTGRKWEYNMFTISWKELCDYSGVLQANQDLENRLIYGMYPEVIVHHSEERERLMNLSQSYLYKDVLSLGKIRKPELLQKLLKALALQLGNEVSYNELSLHLQIDKNTVINYIDLLEKTFVVFRLASFSRNARNEIVTGRKIYFYDNGIRNALIANFSPLALRNDTGALWENFLITERMKVNQYKLKWANQYFWRTKTQQEIDYIEEADGKILAVEFKWKNYRNTKVPKSFAEAYTDATFKVVTKENFENFLLE